VTPDRDSLELEAGARKLSGAILDNSGLSVERMPGLAAVLDRFVAELPHALAPLIPGGLGRGAFEQVHATSLFRALADCAGLTAAIYSSAESEARLLIALDERLDDLIVGAIFGQSVSPGQDDNVQPEAPPSRTAIETALVVEFSRTLGRALEAGFAPLAPLALTFERLIALNDAFALGRRDMPAAAARFSLPMNGGAFEGLVLLPQTLLMPLRKELGHDQPADTPAADPRWSRLMERGVEQTRLPVIAVLEEVPMSLGDVASLRVGEILPLRSNDFEGVRLESSGRGMFLCKLGQGEGRYRLEIESAIAEGQETAVR
jgi:flagellar motor switch protein FliM